MNLFNRRSVATHAPFWAGFTAVAVCALIIGCGGGGGGAGPSNQTNATTATGTNTGANTGTNTTGTASAGGTSTGVTGGSGVLPANSIIYTELTGDASLSYNIRYISFSNSGNTDNVLAASVPATVELAAINPTTGHYILAIQSASGQPYGIYSSSTPSMNGAVQLVSPVYYDVASLAISQDGKSIVFCAAASSVADYELYYVSASGGTPQALDLGESSSISPDSDTIAYSKFVGGTTQLFLYSITKGPIRQLTNNSNYNDFPQFSKDGTKIVFSTTGTNQLYGLATTNLTGSSTVVLPNSSNLNEKGASFNSAGTSISFVGKSANANGLYTFTSTGANLTSLKQSAAILSSGTYWTTAGGRTAGGSSGALSGQKLRNPHK